MIAEDSFSVLDLMILGAMREADELGVEPTLERLANRLHTDVIIVGESVDRLTAQGRLSHTADDPSRVSPDAVIRYEGDLPTV